MKVLAIMGSPRKNGTGTKVVREIESNLNNRGDVKVEVLYLTDFDILPCRGCFTCIKFGEARCPIRDDLVKIEQMIEKADGLILVSPGYVQNVSGLMKNFMDRMAYTNHRPRFFGKKMMIVANGGAGLSKTLDALRIAIGGPEVVSELQYMQLPWPTRPKAQAKKEKDLDRATAKFFDALMENDMQPSFSNYLRFRFFKTASESAKKWLPADYEYYHDLTEYYYDVKIGIGTKILATISMNVAMRMMRNMAPWPEGEMSNEDAKPEV